MRKFLLAVKPADQVRIQLMETRLGQNTCIFRVILPFGKRVPAGWKPDTAAR